MAVGPDGNQAYLVSLQDSDFSFVEPLDNVPMRVAVEILKTGRDYGKRRVHRIQKWGSGRSLAAVVCHFEPVCHTVSPHELRFDLPLHISAQNQRTLSE